MRRLPVFPLLVCLCPAARGEVVHVEVSDRTDLLEGKSFGAAGAYERVLATVRFAIDPKLPANRIISDIDRAPVNEKGRVEFAADLCLLKPRDSAKGNGTVLFEVSNRGGKGMLGMFNLARGSRDPQTEAELGDGFLLERGFTLAWLGWQFDVPMDSQLLRLHAPVAKDGDRPIRGLIRSEFVPDKKVRSFSLGDRTMIPYPVANPEDSALRLTVRERTDGPRRVIPREQWQFARDEGGRPVADRTAVFLADGFEPGRIYEIVYEAQDPVLVGLGPAAVRDFISFLKHGTPAGGTTLLGDQRQHIRRAIGFGTSQSGRFLRTFLYYGFNADEQNRRVFDGVWAHVAGAGRGSFNHRFAQPSRDGHPFMNLFYPTDIFPFTDLEQSDPETALTGGILSSAEKAGVAPKVFYTNSSYEYYGRAASLTHTTLDGSADAPLARDTRIYLFAGTQHGPASFPPVSNESRNLPNPNDFRFAMRALLAAMNQWISDGTEPPAARLPKIANGTLVPLDALAFPKLPGQPLPKRIQRAWRVDYGPEFRSKGIVSIEPPKVGKPFVVLVPQTDADGNETSGIRLPDVAVPLATYTGWNLRDPKIGAPEELFSMAGSFLPFPRTKAERAKNGDPRRSIEERHSSRADYLGKVEAAARDLVGGGYVLESDVPKLLDRAARQWDYLMQIR